LGESIIRKVQLAFGGGCKPGPQKNLLCYLRLRSSGPLQRAHKAFYCTIGEFSSFSRRRRELQCTACKPGLFTESRDAAACQPCQPGAPCRSCTILPFSAPIATRELRLQAYFPGMLGSNPVSTVTRLAMPTRSYRGKVFANFVQSTVLDTSVC
jgi:hypothetical protein